MLSGVESHDGQRRDQGITSGATLIRDRQVTPTENTRAFGGRLVVAKRYIDSDHASRGGGRDHVHDEHVTQSAA